MSFVNNNREIVSKNQSLFRMNVDFVNVGVIFSIFGKKLKSEMEINLYWPEKFFIHSRGKS